MVDVVVAVFAVVVVDAVVLIFVDNDCKHEFLIEISTINHTIILRNNRERFPDSYSSADPVDARYDMEESFGSSELSSMMIYLL